MITSSRNSLVQQLKKLGLSTQERRLQGLFLLEGTHVILEAIATNYPLQVVCCTLSWADKYAGIYARLLELAERIEFVNEEVLTAIATTKSPDGIVATAAIGVTDLPEIQTLGLCLESIQDPGNLGSLIRTSVAVGVDGIILSKDCVDIYHPKILRATAGQCFRAKIAVVEDLTTSVKRLQQNGIQVIATLADAETIYWDYDFRQPTLILLGSEGQGLSADLRSLADRAIRVPLAPQVESLNVSVCGAILLYEALRQLKS
jgi:RNA methyltransferase, TrmH family